MDGTMENTARVAVTPPRIRPWYAANEILAFLLELGALATLTWWGFTTGHGAMRILLGLGTPALAITLWALFAAPKARLRPGLPLVLMVKAVVLGGGATAVYEVGHPTAAIALAGLVVANTAVAETFRRSRQVGLDPLL
ncbi:YrdB family protein [Streptomyces sp. NPDC056160]|uniref:YrdB family protein n=1 Tax=Streptomyces sp. NPDC056160 TaxID=3345731 RepID=UPI0035DCF12C